VAPGWTYGFPELEAGQAAKVAAARKVANPGCYPSGGIALIRPLVDAGLMPRDFPVTVNAVSGYSGGGRSMIEAYEGDKAPAFELYGLALTHKHVPELQLYSGLTRRPLFVPSVGNFRQGMLVSLPLHLDALPGKPAAKDLEAALVARYRDSALVKVVPAETGKGLDRLEPQALNETDVMELRVYAHAEFGQAVLVARLDNLGKGASGAAVQNLGLMLGLGDIARRRAA
jgi:N-acetyl-gamma-glutamyl-phosphate reductase